MSIFKKNKKPLPRTVRFYEDEPQTLFERVSKFPIFVTIAVVLVALMVAFMFCINYENNALKMFIKSSSKNFDSGSFDYKVEASIDGVVYQDFDGTMEFDLDNQYFLSSYHAVYENYEYDAVAYAKGVDAYRGSYYNEEWRVDSYKDRALDFFDFYRDYRKGDFDAGAVVRFTGTNTKFNAVQLNTAVTNISKELTKSSTLNNVLCQSIENGDSYTTVTFTPKMDKLCDIIVENIGPAYTSANAYSDFKTRIEDSRENLTNAAAVLTYTIDSDGYLTDVVVDYVSGGHEYVIDITMNNFAVAKAQVPDGFLKAAGIE